MQYGGTDDLQWAADYRGELKSRVSLPGHQRRTGLGAAGGGAMGAKVRGEGTRCRSRDSVYVVGQRYRGANVPGGGRRRHAGNSFHVQGNADIRVYANYFCEHSNGRAVPGAESVQVMAASKSL